MSVNNNSSFNEIIDIASFITLTTVLLYVTGWAYAYHYYANFQLGLLTLDIPFEYHLIYGFYALGYWWLLLIVIIILLIWIANYLLSKTSEKCLPVFYAKHTKWFLLVIPMMFLIIIFLGKTMANIDFQRQRNSDFPDYPKTKVWLKPASIDDIKYRDLAKQLPQGCYRLLLQNSGKLYLFMPLGSQTPPHIPVVEISEDDVATIIILPENTSC
ncbi:MAG: hypothetical protein WCH01_12355 [Methylococcaceae bacterium]